MIVFTALSLVLEPIRIPVLFWPGQYFRITELPIIIAFFLFGFRAGFSVALLGAFGHTTIFPEATGVLAFPWHLAALLSLFLGLELATKLVNRKFNKASQPKSPRVKPVFYFTALGILSRASIMPFIDYAMYRLFVPLVMGRTYSDLYILALMPASVAFNILVPLVIVPIAYFTAKLVAKNMGIGNKLP